MPTLTDPVTGITYEICEECNELVELGEMCECQADYCGCSDKLCPCGIK